MIGKIIFLSQYLNSTYLVCRGVKEKIPVGNTRRAKFRGQVIFHCVVFCQEMVIHSFRFQLFAEMNQLS